MANCTWENVCNATVLILQNPSYKIRKYKIHSQQLLHKNGWQMADKYWGPGMNG